MISETTTAALVTGAAFLLAIIVPETLDIPIDPVAIGGGGIGVTVVIMSRAFLRRVDTLLDLMRGAVEAWHQHVQRTENIHKVALRLASDDIAVPSESIERDITPLPVHVGRFR